ncbi:retrovirus-related pol polyprotein from transposon TNT 1-94 [Tanacetum coccineum]|uniref:Retrovirus-related pol polyprotein from transposon TNT 1-94 n=1 Tax=Tanacetum coccineum TaxID=301880 RepID=A0ABQ5G3A5_9ASTR
MIGDKGDTSQKGHGSYLLMTGDNSGNLITHLQLKGVNYEEWAMAMQTALQAKKKIGFIDGTIKEPATGSADVEYWWMINSMIVSWIFNTIEPTLHSQISYFELAKDLWDDLKQRFSIKLWDELANYERLLVCKRSDCKCNITKELVKRQEEERVDQFVMGLEEETYRMACSNVLATDPLPNVSQVYSIMIREEKLRNISGEKDTNGCFDIIGYLEWYIEKYGSDKTRGKGNIVRGRNVTGDSSSKGKEQPPRVNASMISSILAYDSKTN